MDQHNANERCEEFGSKYMKGITRILGDVMTPEALRHAVCSALQFALWYKALASGQKEA